MPRWEGIGGELPRHSRVGVVLVREYLLQDLVGGSQEWVPTNMWLHCS